MNPKLTAYALNELSAEEAAALKAQLATDPALSHEAAEIESFCALLQSELSPQEAVTLTPQQRESVQAAFQEPPPPIRPAAFWRRRALLGAASLAACLAIAGLLQIPPQPTGLGERPTDQAKGGADSTATRQALGSAQRNKAESGTPVAAPAPMTAAAPQPPPPGEQRFIDTSRKALRLEVLPRHQSVAKAPTDNLPVRLDEVSEHGKSVGPAPNALARTPGLLAQRSEPQTLNSGRTKLWRDLLDRHSDESKESRPDLLLQPGELAASADRFRPIAENPFVEVAREPVSTFSSDVDTASYSLVRRMLNEGRRPHPDAVRIEELVNYFPYSYPAPSDGKPLAVQADLAEAPWQPLHRLARVALKAREIPREKRSPANLVFLIDVSGSMSPADRLPLIQQSLRLLVEQLGEKDRVAVVTYAGNCQVALESTSCAEKERILQAIDGLGAGGATHGASGIRLAYEQAALHFNKEHVNRVILCTDGDFNVGTRSVDELEALVAEKAGTGVFLSILGVGVGNLGDHRMMAMANRGNGNYAYLDSLSEARKVLLDQMTGTVVAVAKDVKIQVEFNPAQVAAYRLIGYEKRRLEARDFNNDQKDAGDMGAGHTVTALYEIVPAKLRYPNGRPAVDPLKYAQPATEPAQDAIPGTTSGEVMTVKVRYKLPEADTSALLEVPVADPGKSLEQQGPDFQFAAGVAGFGMLLRASPSAKDLSWETVRALATRGKGEDPLGYRGEFIQLVEKARGVSERKR